jgi:hypothetical protein
MHDRNHGRYAPIQLTEGAELIDAAQQGSSAARHVRATLDSAVCPAAKTEVPAQILAGRFSPRELDPATGHSGPDLR